MAKPLLVEIFGDASQYQRTLDKAAGHTKRFGAITKVAGALLVTGLAVGLEKSVKAAMRAEVAQANLATAFKNAHQQIGPYTKRIEEAERAGRKLGFTDEDTKNSLANLITATGDYSKAAKDQAVAQDIARKKGIGLVDATKMLTMAMTGSQRAAKQLGITVQPVTKNFDALGDKATKAEKAHAHFLDKLATGEAVIEAVNKKLHGQAQAFSETTEGKIQTFNAEMDHLKVAVGEKALPALTDFLDGLNGLSDWMSAHPKIAKTLEIGIGGVAGALLAAAAAQWAFNIAVDANPYVAAAIAAVALTGAIILLGQKFKWARDILNVFELFLVGPLGAAIVFTVNHFELVKKIINGIRDALVETASGFLQFISKWLGGLSALFHAMEHVPVVGKMFGAVANEIDAARGKVDALRGSIDGLHSKTVHISVVIDVFQGALASALASINSAISSAQQAAQPHKGGHRAGGGAVRRGLSYVVGERGQELFTPGVSGMITPNGAGAMQVNLQLDGRTVASLLVDPLRNEVRQLQRRGGRF